MTDFMEFGILDVSSYSESFHTIRRKICVHVSQGLTICRLFQKQDAPISKI